MKTIYNVYESLLGNIEDALDKGESDMAGELVNSGSFDENLLKIFTVRSEKPSKIGIGNAGGSFKIDYSKGKAALIVTPAYTYRATAWCGDKKLSDILPGINEICMKEGGVLNGINNSVQPVVSDKDLAPIITGDLFTVRNINTIKNIDFNVHRIGDTRYSASFMRFDAHLDSIENCNIDIKPTRGDEGKLFFYKMPVFKNVSGNGVSMIQILYDKCEFGYMFKDYWKECDWSKIFDFGYEVSYTVNGIPGKPVKIRNIKTFKTLVSAKDAYYRKYNDWPVKIKPNAKLSDLWDVSKFDGLKYVIIYDYKMSIVFENTAISDSMAKTVFKTMLKCEGETVDSIKPYIPVTADGWRVFVTKY